jgi:LysM repeat protein
MEDMAKFKVRQKLMEKALVFDCRINLKEEEKTENKKDDRSGQYFDYIVGEEGFRPFVYDDKKPNTPTTTKGKGVLTAGYGMNMERGDAKDVFRGAFGEEEGNRLHASMMSGGRMSEDQAKQLTMYDINTTFVPRTRSLVRDFDKMPVEVQSALVSSTYRGTLPGSPNALKALNAGDIEGFKRHYIDRKDYKTVKNRLDKEVGDVGRLSDWDYEKQTWKTKPLASTTTSAPTPVPATSVARVSAPETTTISSSNRYKVKGGDSMSKIAQGLGMSVQDLINKNPDVKDPNKIQIGQELNY